MTFDAPIVRFGKHNATMDLEYLQNKRWLRRALMALAGLLLLWALAWLAVPPLLRHELQSRGSEALGRSLTVGEVEFRPWSLELTLHDLALAGRDGKSPQLSVARLYINAELQSLFRLAPVLDALEVDQPVLHLSRTRAGHYDIDDLIELASQPTEPGNKPVRFALYNLVLSGGAIDFDDQPVQAHHSVRELSLSLPFLSNFDSRREVLVQPRLAFTLNGSHFDSQAQAKPFAQTRPTEAEFNISHLDLAPYLAYLPASLPVRPRAAVLDADLKLVFEQQERVALSLTGRVSAREVSLVDKGGAPVLAFPSLTVELADLKPLEHKVHLSAVDWQGPELALQRNAQGRLTLLSSATQPGPEAAAQRQASTDAASPPWALELDALKIRSGKLAWQDNSPRVAARVQLEDLSLDAAGLSWPMHQAARFSGGVSVAAPAASAGKGPSAAGRLQFEGQGTDQAASVSVRLDGLPLDLANPYLQSVLTPTLRGRLSLVAGIGWRAPDLAIQANTLTVDDLALQPGSGTLASWQQLKLQDARLDLSRHTVSLSSAALLKPQLQLARDAQGHWMYEDWLASRAQGPDTVQTPHMPAKAQSGDRRSASTASTVPWHLNLDQLSVQGGALAWRDQAAGRKVAVDLGELSLQLGALAFGGDQLDPRPISLKLATQVGGGRGQAGHLAYQGLIRLAPLGLRGRLEATRLPLQAVEPYFAEALNIELLRADTSFHGRFDYAAESAGPKLRLVGDAALEDVRVNSVLAQVGADAGPPISDELLSWKNLNLQGIDFSMAPGNPLMLNIQETALSDFYARVVISDTGRINLQNLVRSPPEAVASGPAVPPASTGQLASVAHPKQGSAAPAGTGQAVGPKPVIHFGPVSLVNGHVLFSDRFIRPNYSADLTDLTGSLSAFSSEASGAASPALADLSLRGRAQGTGSLEITGQINPLAQPLALNIEGKVRDIDLPPLSPYAVKYAGYGIERGKLSVNVSYKVQPDGRLEASNNIVLNQLSFGDKAEGAANTLPVKLAVALLADSHGVIDVDLPISGSINDPNFRLAPIIGRLILNLVAKAITAPFSLLAHAFSGDTESSNKVPFAPGSAVLGAQARATLDKVAQALIDRPALKLTVVGQVDLQGERDGYRHERLQQMLLAEKARQQVKDGQAAAAQPVELSAEERGALLRAVYRRADIPKPRNLLGLAKDLPEQDIESLLLASIPLSDELLQAVATQRGLAVRDYLAQRQVPVERLFLGAAKTLEAQGGGGPSAELKLDAR